MATLTKTYGATLYVGGGTIQYYGTDVNNFFGSSGDRIAMLKLDAPASIEIIEYIASAILRMQLKGDTTSGSGNVTIGLISGSWLGNTSGGYSALLGYCNGPTISKSISYTTTSAEKQIDVKTLLQTWAENPSAYSGLYIRNSALPLARIGGTDCDITTTIANRTACGRPTSVSLSKTTADPGTSVTMSWSGAAPGTENPITGYRIYKSTNGGSYALLQTVNTTATSGSITVTANSTQGAADKYKVVTKGTYTGLDSIDSPEVTLTTITYTPCGAPTSITLSKEYANPNEEVTLSWSGAVAGIGNPIDGYFVYVNRNGAGYEYFSYVTTTATSGSCKVTANGTQGEVNKYKIITDGSHIDSTGYSPEASLVTQTYTAPTAPPFISTYPGTVNPGTTSFLSWYGEAPGSNNPISGYEVHRSTTPSGTYTKIADTVSPGCNVTAPATGGNYYYYRILTKGTVAGLNSELSIVYGMLRANASPSAPNISAPINDTVTYNSRPRILLTVGNEPENQAQSVTISGYTPSSDGAQASGKKLVFRRSSAATEGTQSILAKSTDTLGVSSSQTTRNFEYIAPLWTDGMLYTGTNRIKAQHMNELRQAVNQIRAYYGLSAYVWEESIIAGETSMASWASHVSEIRNAIEEIATLVNGWDATSTTHNILLPVWIEIAGMQPSAAVMNQLRATIALL